MVRVAQGNLAMLLPSGVATVDDMPADLMLAITHARLVLSWEENLLKKEQPPSWMWPFPEELKTWFEEVEIARDHERGGSPDPDDPTMTRNTFFDDK